ncbi:conserved exported protein of unknown function [Vibrio tapetis subsp. tapetis]|uniref:Porin n=1 Tax=Vibrio tapetis subsp. tapetis TaxID=1671868 RepID=A0A2N8ZIZ0_9VIBR|nr:hypothetical protein [Vibrio tapetis]SON51868.1 conserved exported protein of unknown function [Vibrio tapetis subsp. tapetis]
MNKTCLSKSKLLMTFVAANTLLISAEVTSSEHKPISVVGDYYMFGLSSSDPLQGKDNSAASGIARITLDWLALEDESTLDKGSFRIRVDHKHSYTEDSPSNYVMNNIGGFGLIQPAFSDIGLRLTNLYWKQEFNSQDTELMVGFLDSTDYVDTYALGNPYSGFSNLHSAQVQARSLFQMNRRSGPLCVTCYRITTILT